MRSLLMLAALTLAGCDARAPTNPGATTLWTDPTTGCRYIVYADGLGNARVGSLSIRLREDGIPDCPKAKQ